MPRSQAPRSLSFCHVTVFKVGRGALKRNLVVLFIAQFVAASGSIVVVTLGGIVGSGIAPVPELATLPLSSMVVGAALCTIPAALIMQRIGRRLGFALAALFGAMALALAAWAAGAERFYLFCIATGLFGVNMAFVQQYRFAAAESVDASRTSVAVSLVLLGSIGGAFLGPRLISLAARHDPQAPYGTAFYAVGLLLAVSAIMLGSLLREDSRAAALADRPAGRPLRALLSQQGFLTAVVAGVCSYGVMTLVMTATPVSMHVSDGHSLDVTGWVISSHVAAMYAPSLFSGFLIARFGCRLVMIAGASLLAASLLFGLQGQAVMHYWLALVALGVGWNFLYVGGTTLLTRFYRPEERFKAQAFNDFCVFGVAAIASLASGAALHYLGWHWLMFVPMPVLALALIGFFALKSEQGS